MTEQWRPIPGWRFYEASDLGRVRSVTHTAGTGLPGKGNYCRVIEGRVLTPWPHTRSGHLMVRLKEAGLKKTVKVHQVVLQAHGVLQPTSQHEVRHLNGVENDNRLENLEWSTRRRNAQDRKWHKGHGHHKLRPGQVSAIKVALEDGAYGIGRRLARKYGVSEGIISAIKNGRIHEDVL